MISDKMSVEFGKVRFDVKQFTKAKTVSSQDETFDTQGNI